MTPADQRVPGIVIVADDLSSATDCSVQMIAGGYRAVVLLESGYTVPENVDIVAFDTDSRNLPAEQALAATRRCIAEIPAGTGSVFYKSVDSTLRGNLGAEIEAILGFGEFDGAIVAPAFPTWGRTTQGGLQYLDGVPLHETEFGSDPTAPVTTSVIADRIAEQCGHAAALIPLDILNAGKTAVRNTIDESLADGAALFVFDAAEETDLERIAETAGSLPHRMLWVGSTGLSRYVPGAIGLPARPARPAVSAGGGPVMIVAGSASETTRRQLDACNPDEVQVDALSIARGGAEADAEFDRARALLRSCDGARTVALTLTTTRADIAQTRAAGETRGMSAGQVSALLVRTLGQLTAELIENGAPLAGLVLTGGDTAKTLASCLGARAIEILDEIEPGIPLGRIVGPHEMFIVTKAGGFGSDLSLARSVDIIGRYGVKHDVQ